MDGVRGKASDCFPVLGSETIRKQYLLNFQNEYNQKGEFVFMWDLWWLRKLLYCDLSYIR
jgi:hypothetical protein